MEAILKEIELPYRLKNHKIKNLIVHSEVLKGNPLGDPSIRHNYILAPELSEGPLPVIFHLAGYFSTGYQNFYEKTLQENFVQRVERGVKEKKYPRALHVFVEATTYWGGSQFINSPGCGRYSDYILQELVKAVDQNFETSASKCVMGGSSGAYGALHLISQKKSPFDIAFATAPDSFFEASLLPELLTAAPQLLKYKSFKKIKKLIAKNELQDKRSFFSLANAIAMAHCYSPSSSIKEDFIEFPIDLFTGEINTPLWKQWLKHDPLIFLKKSKEHLKAKKIYLDVGKYDNFSLQYGTRQIFNILTEQKVNCEYSEFSGTHSGLSERRLLFLEKLNSLWSANG